MKDAIENLYSVFKSYRIGNDFAGCDCCVTPDHCLRLTTPPLHELTFDDLERYSRKAITTWGTVHHFKHFLPRLLELTIEYRDEFLDLAVVFGKFTYANWDTWQKREQEAVAGFFNEYWRYQLAVPIVNESGEVIDTVLCALSNAHSSLQSFLEEWLHTNSENAKRHLAAFIWENADMLIEKEQLWNSFWDTNGKPHQEVINWLKTEAVYDYLDDCKKSNPNDRFLLVKSQLEAIRSSSKEFH